MSSFDVKLRTADGKVVNAPINLLKACKTYGNMIEDLGEENLSPAFFDGSEPLTLGPVNENSFNRVLEFIKLHNGSYGGLW